MSLLDRPAGELLDLFAAGTTTPGAVSAAALQGALAASLIQAVARYTLKTDPAAQALLGGARERSERLRRAADEDAAAFARYWRSRTEADLWPAIDIPLAVARDCGELAAMAFELHESGFRRARGESFAAAWGAVAAGDAALYAARGNLSLARDAGRIAAAQAAIGSLAAALRELRERFAGTLAGA